MNEEMDMLDYIDYPGPVGRNVSPRRAAFFGGLSDRQDCGIAEFDVRPGRKLRRVCRFVGIVGGLLVGLASAALCR